MSNTFTTTTASSPVATYGTRAGIEGIYGRDNVRSRADLNSNGVAAEIAAQIDRARTHAYQWINSKLRGARLTAPATSDNFGEFDLLDDVEDERAGAWLYFHRGVNEQQGPEGADAAMQWHWDHAEKELDRLIGVVAAGDGDDATAGAGTFQVITINRGRCGGGDEFSGRC